MLCNLLTGPEPGYDSRERRQALAERLTDTVDAETGQAWAVADTNQARPTSDAVAATAAPGRGRRSPATGRSRVADRQVVG